MSALSAASPAPPGSAGDPGDPGDLGASLARAQRASAVLVGVCLALAVGLVLAARRSGERPDGAEALRDDEVRREAVRELVSRGAGVWDSHVDPDVGRVLQPGLEGRELFEVPIVANRFGMREREYGPKEPGTTRVVLLGDSFVLGHGISVEERLGTFVERFLSEKSGRPVEVLSLGISSWNIVSECAYLRRQLSFLEPDLVVQLVFNNDLDDMAGVRGFGARARFSPQHRGRADGMVTRDAPWEQAGVKNANLILYGLDWESRERYRLAAEALAELAAAVEERGGQYLCLALWGWFQPMVERALAVGLAPDQLAYVSDAFLTDKSIWASPDNYHWGAEGNGRVARMLYALARERGLLPGLELPAWAEADADAAAIDGVGRREAADDAGLAARLSLHQVASRIDFGRLTQLSGALINGGVDGEGYAAPYASLTLARGDGSELVVRARRLGTPELRDGARCEVFVEEVALGEIALEGTEEVDLRLALPAALLEREHLSVRFVSDDWVYRGEALDRCVALRLVEVAVE